MNIEQHMVQRSAIRLGVLVGLGCGLVISNFVAPWIQAMIFVFNFFLYVLMMFLDIRKAEQLKSAIRATNITIRHNDGQKSVRSR